jgi:hypothetical protein
LRLTPLMVRDGVQSEARLKACRLTEAWVEGNTLKAKELVGHPIHLEPYGQGMVDSYNRGYGIKKKGHTVHFDIGRTEVLRLDYDTAPFRAVDYRFVDAYVEREMEAFEAESDATFAQVEGEALDKVLVVDEAWRPGGAWSFGFAVVLRGVLGGAHLSHGCCTRRRDGRGWAVRGQVHADWQEILRRGRVQERQVHGHTVLPCN